MMLFFWILLSGLVWTGSSNAADCTLLPENSFARGECEHVQRKAAGKDPDRTFNLSNPPAAKDAGGKLSGMFANDASPPVRFKGAEPAVTVVLQSGSTTRADKTWVEGDRLWYWSRGVKGSFRLVDVDRVEDLSYAVARAICNEKELAHKENRQAAVQTMATFSSLPQQLAMEMWREAELLGREAARWCGSLPRRFEENTRIFYEARARARQKEQEAREVDAVPRQ